jgi:enamine deaminase RidA (YjgF/YER057c/UK114 family)
MQKHTITRINPQDQWSDAVVHSHNAYFVEVPESGTDIESQTRALLAQAEATLTRLGSDKRRLIMATIVLKHMKDRAAFNAIWAAWLPEGCAPARMCISAEMASPDYLLEIAFIAASPL